MTLNFAKDVINPFNPEKQMKSCGEYIDNDYDKCIEEAVSKEIGRLFNCSLPFLRPDEKFLECDLANITEAERKHYYDSFQGLLLSKKRVGTVLHTHTAI